MNKRLKRKQLKQLNAPLISNKKGEIHREKYIEKLKKKYRQEILNKRKYSPLIINEKGELQKENYEKYIKILKDTINMADYFDLEDIIKSWPHNTDTKGKKLTLKTLMSKKTENRREKMFINAGITLEEAANELGANDYDLLNENLWSTDDDDNPIFKWEGEFYLFNFTYEGSVWTLLKN